MKNQLSLQFLDNSNVKEILADSFGADITQPIFGELVFQTGMVGYIESLTDPSYAGQILVLTYPMIGNYGVPNINKTIDLSNIQLPLHLESRKIQVAGLIVQNYEKHKSHWQASITLDEWLKKSGIPALYNVDTRYLTKMIRQKGTISACISNNSFEKEDHLNHLQNWKIQKDLVHQVVYQNFQDSTQVIQINQKLNEMNEMNEMNEVNGMNEQKTILVIDCGIKFSQIKYLFNLGFNIKWVPYNYPIIDLVGNVDAIFISNGPGDPTDCQPLIKNLKNIFNQFDQQIIKIIPIFGICLGHQIISLALGANTQKMPFGNRGHNIPVRLTNSQLAIITTQNHGYEVLLNIESNNDNNNDNNDNNTIKPLFINANDHSNEGIYHSKLPIWSVQFHPEAKAGPEDSIGLFNVFSEQIHTQSSNNELLIERIKTNLGRGDYNENNIEYLKSLNETCVRKILIVGSGGLTIGQAGEFDYSGSQAIKAFKEENLQVVLINPNPATVQTTPNEQLADQIYYLPLTIDSIRDVIQLEKPEYIALSFGGQTALNLGLQLNSLGILKESGIKVIGTGLDAIQMTENREEFGSFLKNIGESLAPSDSAKNLNEAVQVVDKIGGYPVLIRSGFALGGLGSGFAHNKQELIRFIENNLGASALNENININENSDMTSNDRKENKSKVITIDKSLKGWREVEYEVVRDCYGNCITVCNMENFDPVGIHTGESIVVAPSQTLTNDEYNLLRTVSIRVIQNLGIIGECNIQFALSPHSSEYYIIEVNARLSRSSALASKATGYPLAYIAAKLGLGYSLLDIKNKVTGGMTTSCFEPSLDYCVVKVPKWDLDKFNGVHPHLHSAMKSVGEAMAIGRDFNEAFQKALRMAYPQTEGFHPIEEMKDWSNEQLCNELMNPTPKRVHAIAKILTSEFTQDNYQCYSESEDKVELIEKIYELTGIHKWFLNKIYSIIQVEEIIKRDSENRERYIIWAKKVGISDARFAKLCGKTTQYIKSIRHITPFVKQIDTVAGEFPCTTNYLYLTYHASEHDLDQAETDLGSGSGTGSGTGTETGTESVIVLGSGVYRIGSSVEFDWSAVSAIRQLRESGYQAIMINTNPETVSTDWDEADRLYFEELTNERVLDIVSLEKDLKGVIVSMGGQAANNIVMKLFRAGVKILGTDPQMIDSAENRFKFSRMLDDNGVDQPIWREATSLSEAKDFCNFVEYPVLVRPSYVLSGAAMRVVECENQLAGYLEQASKVSPDYPVVISKFIQDAREIEVDAIANNGKMVKIAISEHVENAGVHSGDATLIHPPIRLNNTTIHRVEEITKKIAESLKITGPFNIQLLAKENKIKVIECNVRASRSLPFVSKVQGENLAKLATKVILNEMNQGDQIDQIDQINQITELDNNNNNNNNNLYRKLDCPIGVKMAQFSFNRLPGADPRLGVEMQSTGEVIGFGSTIEEAYLKAYRATFLNNPCKLFDGGKIKRKINVLLSIGPEWAKIEIKKILDSIYNKNNNIQFDFVATTGTANWLKKQQIKYQLKWINYFDLNRKIIETFDLIINISNDFKDADNNNNNNNKWTNGYKLRQTAIQANVPLMTNTKGAKMLLTSLIYMNRGSNENINKNLGVKAHIDSKSTERYYEIPPLFDMHVHIREPGKLTYKGGWITELKAALSGGYGGVGVMPNLQPAITSSIELKNAEKYIHDLANSGNSENINPFRFVDWTLYIGASETNYKDAAKLAKSREVLAMKMYLNSTFGDLKLNNMISWRKHLKHWPEGVPIIVHAEGQTLAAFLFLAISCKKAHHIHVAHISTLEDIEIIKTIKNNSTSSIKLTCEVAPHHLFLESNNHNNNNNGLNEVRPRLTKSKDVEALWNNLDLIDCFATDHAPHTIDEKLRTDSSAPPGFPGLETALPLLLTAVSNGRLTMNRLIEMACYNPLKILGLHSHLDWVKKQFEMRKTYLTVCVNSIPRLIGTVDHHSHFNLNLNLSVDTSFKQIYNNDNNQNINDKRVCYSNSNWSPFYLAHIMTTGELIEYNINNQMIVYKGLILNQMDKIDQIDQTEYNSEPLQIKNKNKINNAEAIDTFENIIINNNVGDVEDVEDVGDFGDVGDIDNQVTIENKQSKIVWRGLKSFISIEDLERRELKSLFNYAAQIKRDFKICNSHSKILEDYTIGAYFEEWSSRTALSFEAAAKNLGAKWLNLDHCKSSRNKGETLNDTIKCLESYSDLIITRTKEDPREFIDKLNKGTGYINAGNGTEEHPTQTLLDLFTIRELRGSVTGLNIMIVGDAKRGRTIKSLIKGLGKYQKVTIRLVTPLGVKLEEESQLREWIRQNDGICRFYEHVFETGQQFETICLEHLEKMDVLYMTRMQLERSDEYNKGTETESIYKIDSTLLSKANASNDLLIMHPLPRVDEIDEEVDEDHRAVYFEQMRNGLFVRMALLSWLIKPPKLF